MTKSCLEWLQGWRSECMTQQEMLYLLQHVMQQSTAELYGNLTTPLLPEAEAILRQWLRARVSHIPLAYLTHRKEFWDLDLTVHPTCFIPRADSECIVAFILENMPLAKRTVLDLGTGSGALGLALKKHRPAWDITLVDICPDALHIARQNAQRYQLDVRLLQSDWYRQLTGTFDIIVANPPYISSTDEITAEIFAEPSHALFAADDGMQALKIIIMQGYAFLKGCLVVEHGDQQGVRVLQLFRAAHYQHTLFLRDLHGKHRATVGFKTAF